MTMNSMLRQNSIHLEDVSKYLKGYDPERDKSISPEEWAKSESAAFEQGMLVFCLETIAAPPGLSTFNKKEGESNKFFRVRDFGVVVAKENGRVLVVNITASAYELRFLEVLLLEKARKAILDARGFLYLAARPTSTLSGSTIKDIAQLGNLYAQGGSRRSITAGSSSLTEPAMALLGALGVSLAIPASKQVLDIGYVCHLLFADNGQQEDGNKTLLKANFIPMSTSGLPAAPTAAKVTATDTFALANNDAGSFAPTLLPPDPVPSTQAGFQLSTALDPKAAEKTSTSSRLPEQPAFHSTDPEQANIDDFDYSLFEKASEFFSKQENEAGLKTYKHLAEALSGLGLASNDQEATVIEKNPTSALFKSAGSDSASLQSNNVFTKSAIEEQRPKPTQPLAKDLTLGNQPEPSIAPKQSQVSDALKGQINLDAQTIGKSGTTALNAPETADEPQALLNEMVSLMSKLEQQVSKASKKLASKAEEIELRLNRRVEALLQEAGQENKNIEASILVLCDSLTKQFEQLSEELRLKISDAAASGREAIKLLQGSGQTKLDETHSSVHDALLFACNNFCATTEASAKASEEQLHTIVGNRMEELESVVKSILNHLDSIAGEFEAGIGQRFTRFTERMGDEANALINSVDRNVRSITEEIDGSLDRASNKLNASRKDFEQTIEHTISTAKLSISHSSRTLSVDEFLPKLKERRQIVAGMAGEMAKAFIDQASSQILSQIIGLENSLASAQQQLKSLFEECLDRIDTVGRLEQAGLEDLFKDAGGNIEKNTANVLSMIDGAEQRIHDIETTCKKLAETSSLEADPYLSEERNQTFAKVQSLKAQVKSELDKSLDLSCAKLEQLGQAIQSHLSGRRLEQTQAVREACDDGLNRIREAIQEAFHSIQAAREQYME